MELSPLVGLSLCRCAACVTAAKAVAVARANAGVTKTPGSTPAVAIVEMKQKAVIVTKPGATVGSKSAATAISARTSAAGAGSVVDAKKRKEPSPTDPPTSAVAIRVITKQPSATVVTKPGVGKSTTASASASKKGSLLGHLFESLCLVMQRSDGKIPMTKREHWSCGPFSF